MRTFTHEQLTEDVFRAVWAHGEPLVVTGLESNISDDWDILKLTQAYGKATCDVVNCQTSKTVRTTVGDFFKKFGNYRTRDNDGCLKLKV